VNAEDLRFFLAVREAGSIKGGAPRVALHAEQDAETQVGVQGGRHRRNNPRVRAVKEALVEMMRAAAPQLDGSATT
jgi:hypothetical protein